MNQRGVFLSIVVFISSLGPGNVTAGEVSENEKIYKISIVQQAWHTGIILSVEDIPDSLWVEKRYKNNKFIDISWGDEKYYQSRGNPVGLAIRAIIWPTQSVIRVYPFSNPVGSAYGSDARIQTISLSEKEFLNLCHFIAESFKRDEEGKTILSTENRINRYYYLAKRKYHLFRTCNTWVALALKKSGLKIRSCCILNANQLFRQLDILNNEGK